MNYKKIYDTLMGSRLLLKQQRTYEKKVLGLYFEKHHIIPISLDGHTSRAISSENIVLLTAKEHFVAHWLLWLIYKNREMAYAFISMTRKTIKNKQQRYYSSRGYEVARLAFSQINKGVGNPMYGKPSPNRGIEVSKERKKKQSVAMTGRFVGKLNPFFNKNHSNATKAIMSEKAKKRISDKNSNWGGNKLVFLNNKLIGRFKTTAEIADFINGTIYGVKNVLSGNQKTTRGYIIKYE